jgi:hypothetical protein
MQLSTYGPVPAMNAKRNIVAGAQTTDLELAG